MMTDYLEETHNLIFLTIGLASGLLSAIAINLFANGHPEINFVLPGNIVDSVGIFYIILFVIGIALYLRPNSLYSNKFGNILLTISGFLILFGITMIGITMT